MKNIFFCLDCGFEFQNVIWNGSAAVCPKCGSTRWYDISEEKEETKMKSQINGRLAER